MYKSAQKRHLAHNKVNDTIDISQVNLAITIDIGTAVVSFVGNVAQDNVDNGIHICHSDLAIKIDITPQERRNLNLAYRTTTIDITFPSSKSKAGSSKARRDRY